MPAIRQEVWREEPISRVGGLVGKNYSATISACYSTGSVEGGSNNYVGGLVGWNEGVSATISACYSTGSVAGGSRSLM